VAKRVVKKDSSRESSSKSRFGKIIIWQNYFFIIILLFNHFAKKNDFRNANEPYALVNDGRELKLRTLFCFSDGLLSWWIEK